MYQLYNAVSCLLPDIWFPGATFTGPSHHIPFLHSFYNSFQTKYHCHFYVSINHFLDFLLEVYSFIIKTKHKICYSNTKCKVFLNILPQYLLFSWNLFVRCRYYFLKCTALLDTFVGCTVLKTSSLDFKLRLIFDLRSTRSTKAVCQPGTLKLEFDKFYDVKY